MRSVLSSPPARCVVVLDEGLPKLCVGTILASCEHAGMQPLGVVVRPAESTKSLSSLEHLAEKMAWAGLGRAEPVFAVGGGIVGDLAGFAAASYKRGVPLIQCPTTLLAMVDASVGGKTGVNLLATRPEASRTALLKNYLGAFHQPRLVLADVEMLGSLPDREFRAGVAECLKHGMLGADLGESDLWSWMLNHRDAILARDPGTLVELVARNVALKARVVQADEFETAPDDVGGRALLNLGHTFGHAIETMDADQPGYNPNNPALKHGEAVALGLCAAAACSELAGLAQVGILPQVREAVAAFGLPTNVGGLAPNSEIIERMRTDKKAIGGSLRLILPTRIGSARVVRDVPEATIARAIDAIRNMTS